MIFFHGLRLYRLAAAEADMSYTPPFGGAIFFSMVRMIELLLRELNVISPYEVIKCLDHVESCCLDKSVYPVYLPLVKLKLQELSQIFLCVAMKLNIPPVLCETSELECPHHLLNLSHSVHPLLTQQRLL